MEPHHVARHYINRTHGGLSQKEVHPCDGFQVLMDKKMCTVIKDSPTHGGEVFTHVVVFPMDSEHLSAFENAAAGVNEHGPAEDNPGAIGTTKLFWTSADSNPILWSSQSHYLVEGNPRLADPAHGIPWNLVDEYSGWRKRTLNHAVNTVIGKGKELVVPYKFFYPRGFGGEVNEHLLHEFKSVCDESGLHAHLIMEPSVNPLNPLQTRFVVSRHKG